MDGAAGSFCMTMRILFVNRMAGLERGGGETFDLEIARHLLPLGCEVTVLTGRPLIARSPTPVRAPLSAVYVRSPYLPWFPWDKVKGGWRVRVWEFQQFEGKAAAWIEEHADDYDVIQICELPHLVTRLKSAFAAGTPKIVMRLTAPNAYDPWGGIRVADALIASGTSISLIRESLRPDVLDIPNAVDTTRFAPGSLDAEQKAFRTGHGIPCSAPLLLYVARFQGFKNHALLIDALAAAAQSVPEIRLALAGSGPLRGEIEARARRAGVGDRVVFLGEVGFADLPAVYRAADLKVISSDYESFCFAAIEAMASGLPVVTTDCGWVPGLIGDTLPPIRRQDVGGDDPPERFAVNVTGPLIREVPGGLVTARGDAAALAAAIVVMIRDTGKRAACGGWNREKAVREHGWESSAKKLLDLYRKLIDIK
jgi:glycosyltransferase involved in cell wall biosynthesis